MRPSRVPRSAWGQVDVDDHRLAGDDREARLPALVPARLTIIVDGGDAPRPRVQPADLVAAVVGDLHLLAATIDRDAGGVLGVGGVNDTAIGGVVDSAANRAA